jgi:hypothetical protein
MNSADLIAHRLAMGAVLLGVLDVARHHLQFLQQPRPLLLASSHRTSISHGMTHPGHSRRLWARLRSVSHLVESGDDAGLVVDCGREVVPGALLLHHRPQLLALA